MATVVGIHGIGAQVSGSFSEAARWLPAMRDGLEKAGGGVNLEAGNLRVAHWGELFRKRPMAPTKEVPRSDELVRPLSSVTDLGEQETALATLWWEGVAESEGVPGPEATDKFRTPMVAQKALSRLAQSRFFAGIAERVMAGNLRQVVRYLQDDEVNAAVQDRIDSAIEPDTRILVGHSLGSVVAYEYLMAHPGSPVEHLVTLGSPLGITHLVFDRLRPAPVDGHGAWPEGVKSWTNIADNGDVVALVKALAPQFPGVRDILVHNDAQAHDVVPYLTAAETGAVLRSGLISATDS